MSKSLLQKILDKIPGREAYDENGEYSRKLDRRLNQVIEPPPAKYAGQVPVITPESVRVVIGLFDGHGEQQTQLEIDLPYEDLERFNDRIHSRAFQLRLIRVFPYEKGTKMEFEEAPIEWRGAKLETAEIEKIETNLRD